MNLRESSAVDLQNQWIDTRWLRRFVWIAFAWRMLISSLTVVPGRDAVNYLWMSERFLDGDSASALGEVFPPGWSLLMAPFVSLAQWIGLEAFRGAQLANAILGALSVWPILRCAERFGPSVLRLIGWLLVFAPLSVKFGAEALSEPSTQLFLGLGLWAGLGGRSFAAGLFTAVAFAIRPEALALGLALTLARPKAAPWLLLPTALVVVALGYWRQSCGYGFEPIPKFGFHDRYDLGAFTGESIDWSLLANNVWRLPFLFVEALQGLGVLALCGAYLGFRRRRVRVPITALLFASVAICGFIAKRRFFVPWLPAVVVLATYALRRLPATWRLAIFTPAMIFSVLAGLDPQPDDRWAERTVGRHLGSLLEPGQTVTGDQTRVVYFAGCRPLPPRHYDADEIVGWARDESVQFVVLTDYGRTESISERVREDLNEEFTTLPMPEDVRNAAEWRRLIILRRIEEDIEEDAAEPDDR